LHPTDPGLERTDVTSDLFNGCRCSHISPQISIEPLIDTLKYKPKYHMVK
jgi:hypothetical protein